MKPQIDDKPTDDKKQVMTNPSCEEANDKNDRKKPVLTGIMTDGRKHLMILMFFTITAVNGVNLKGIVTGYETNIYE